MGCLKFSRVSPVLGPLALLGIVACFQRFAFADAIEDGKFTSVLQDYCQTAEGHYVLPDGGKWGRCECADGSIIDPVLDAIGCTKEGAVKLAKKKDPSLMPEFACEAWESMHAVATESKYSAQRKIAVGVAAASTVGLATAAYRSISTVRSAASVMEDVYADLLSKLGPVVEGALNRDINQPNGPLSYSLKEIFNKFEEEGAEDMYAMRHGTRFKPALTPEELRSLNFDLRAHIRRAVLENPEVDKAIEAFVDARGLSSTGTRNITVNAIKDLLAKNFGYVTDSAVLGAAKPGWGMKATVQKLAQALIESIRPQEVMPAFWQIIRNGGAGTFAAVMTGLSKGAGGVWRSLCRSRVGKAAPFTGPIATAVIVGGQIMLESSNADAYVGVFSPDTTTGAQISDMQAFITQAPPAGTTCPAFLDKSQGHIATQNQVLAAYKIFQEESAQSCSDEPLADTVGLMQQKATRDRGPAPAAPRPVARGMGAARRR